jgi:hypothetical protein
MRIVIHIIGQVSNTTLAEPTIFLRMNVIAGFETAVSLRAKGAIVSVVINGDVHFEFYAQGTTVFGNKRNEREERDEVVEVRIATLRAAGIDVLVYGKDNGKRPLLAGATLSSTSKVAELFFEADKVISF